MILINLPFTLKCPTAPQVSSYMLDLIDEPSVSGF